MERYSTILYFNIYFIKIFLDFYNIEWLLVCDIGKQKAGSCFDKSSEHEETEGVFVLTKAPHVIHYLSVVTPELYPAAGNKIPSCFTITV